MRGVKVDEREIDRIEAIILSMTPEERRRPELIKGSRRLRIARGSGTSVQAVNQIVKQFGQVRKVMRQVGRGPDARSRRADAPAALSAAGRQGGPVSYADGSFSIDRRDIVAVRLRLTRVGGRKDPVWRVVVADQRSKRDGRVIETVGHYNPQTNPSTITIDEDARARLARARSTAVADGAQAAAHPWHRQLSSRARWIRPSCSSTSPRGSSTTPSRCRSSASRRRDGSVVLELAVGPDDYGKVIGRGGRTAQALRTVIAAAAASDGRRVLVDIVD